MSVKLRCGHSLPIHRVLCEKPNSEANSGTHSIAYSWFVGHDYVTSNHESLSTKDSLDRKHYGYDQRWACITVIAYLDPVQSMKANSGPELLFRTLNGKLADELVAEFIGDIGPDLISVEEVKEWSKE